MKEQRLFGSSTYKDEKELWLTGMVEDNFPEGISEENPVKFFPPFTLHLGIRNQEEEGSQILKILLSKVMTVSELLTFAENIKYFKDYFPQKEVLEYEQGQN